MITVPIGYSCVHFKDKTKQNKMKPNLEMAQMFKC